MRVVKPALTLAILLTSLVCNNAWAQQAPAAEAADAAKPAPSREVAPGPSKKPPIKRRAVHQIIDGMPAPSAPLVYGPRLTPQQPPIQPNILPSTIPSSMAPPPAMISRCDASGCTDTGGARYNGASGTLLSPQGRLCSNNGVMVNCY